MKHVVDIFFPPLPSTLAPTDYVRRWDHAVLLSLVVFAICVLVCALLWSRPLGMGMWFIVWGILSWDEYFAAQATPLHYLAVGSTWALAVPLSALVFRRMLRPYNHLRHISGPRLYDDVLEATKQATIQSTTLMGGQDPWLNVHPSFPVAKTTATRGTLIVGSIGSGKTVILNSHLDQHFKRNRRTLIYDVKGDFTQMHLHRTHCRLFCPWDERSVLWDIARDLDTKAKAKAFSYGFFPPTKGDGKIWNDGAAMIFTAILVEIMREHGTHWGWDTINRWISMSHAELVERLQKDHPLAVKAMAEEGSKTASSMEMTLGIGVQFIADLAQAWSRSHRCERFSWLEWLTNARIQQRQIIVKAGPDRESTSALMGGIFNYLANAVKDSSILPDDTNHSRSLVFCIDEFATINKFEIDQMIMVGRSKGCVITLGMQDLAQVDMIYGKELRQAIEANMFTQIICQVSKGETRKQVSEAFAYKQVASTLPQYTFGTGSSSQTISVKSEPRAIIDAADLTSKLGPRFSKTYKDGFAIRAVLYTNSDPLLLEWEGTRWPKPNEAHVAAAWTKRPMKHRTFRHLYGVMGTDFQRDLETLRKVIKMFDDFNAARRRSRPTALEQWRMNVGGANA